MALVFLETYGCQMNRNEADALAELLRRRGHGLVDHPGRAEVVVLTGCVVRQHAENRAVSRIAELGRHRGLKVLVTGCLAEEAADTLLRRFPHVAGVFAPGHLDRLVETLESLDTADRPHLPLGTYAFPKAAVDPSAPWQASLTVIHGCSNFCSYCVVPFVRGPEISRPSQDILDEARRLADSGVVDLLLLGQNINAYGRDSGDIPFPELLRRLDAIPGLRRIRFLTSHPKDFGPDLVDAVLGLPKVEKKVHLPLQSGSDRILRLMNRRYTLADYLRIVERLRSRPDLCLTTDLIAGFPGETEEDHRLTLEAMRTVRFDEAYMFAYSPRRRTAAASLPGLLPLAERRRRLAEIQALQRTHTLERLASLAGRTCEALLERPSRKDPSEWSGRTETGRTIVVSLLASPTAGSVMACRITGFRGITLVGEPHGPQDP